MTGTKVSHSSTYSITHAVERGRDQINTAREDVEKIFRTVIEKGEATRDETMTTFLATLVLVRRRVLDADQTEPFGPIELWRTAEIVPSLTELIPPDAQEAG